MSKLECDGIAIGFGLRPILSNIYLTCETGEVVGLLGRNGSGKSCLLNIIFGALAADSRSVRIDGNPVHHSFSKHIAYLPQHRFIPSFLTLEKAFKIYAVNTAVVSHYFPDLHDKLLLKPGQVSGGVLRIFELLLICGLPSKFILLDEPFSGIMPVHIERVKHYLKTIKSQKGIIITDHLYRHITEISDTLYILVNGQNYPVKNEAQLVQYGYINS
jgi:ABC-type multidrug transport system ATPase subunit